MPGVTVTDGEIVTHLNLWLAPRQPIVAVALATISRRFRRSWASPDVTRRYTSEAPRGTWVESEVRV